MSRVHVKERTVLSDRLKATEQETVDQVSYVSGGRLRRPELIDRELESPEARRHFDDDAGCISICVAPGDELGALSVNLQFEGKSGLHAINLDRQGSLIEQAGDWLRQILGELGIDYQVEVEAQPCPKTDQRLPMATLVARLEGRSHDTQVASRVENDVQHENQVRQRHGIGHE